MKGTAAKQKSVRARSLRGVAGDTYCVDLSKHHFHVNRYRAHGELQASTALTRTKFELLVRDPQRASGTWVMEACAGSHHWGRVLMARGDKVKLLPAQFVALRRVGNKNDCNDAAAIHATHLDHRVRPVPVKTEAQQEDAAMHAMRRQLVGQRTATLNAIRGQLAERGLITSKGQAALWALLLLVLDGSLLPLQTRLREVLETAKLVVETLNTQLATLNRMVSQHAASSAAATLLMGAPGIGPITASAVATEHAQGVARFEDSRQFAASFGLAPGEHSSGGKPKPIGITRRGNVYLRTLLVQGAQTVLNQACPKPKPCTAALGDSQRPPADHDLHELAQRLTASGKRRAVIVCALANRMARIMYALLKHGEVYRPHRQAKAKGAQAAPPGTATQKAA